MTRLFLCIRLIIQCIIVESLEDTQLFPVCPHLRRVDFSANTLLETFQSLTATESFLFFKYNFHSFQSCSPPCQHYIWLQDHSVVCPNELISRLQGEMRVRDHSHGALEAISSCFTQSNLSRGFHWLCCLVHSPVDIGSATVGFHARWKSSVTLFLCLIIKKSVSSKEGIW